MEREKKSKALLLWLACLVVVSAAQAQAQAPAQAPALAPLPPQVAQEVEACLQGGVRACLPYTDSTTIKPPAACCDAVASVIENNVSCICLTLGNEQVVRALELDLAKTLTLPQRCGLQPFDLSANCPGVAAPPRAPSTFSANAPTSVSMAPSQAPSQAPSSTSIAIAPTSGGEASRASNIAWTGSAVLGSFLLCTTLIFY